MGGTTKGMVHSQTPFKIGQFITKDEFEKLKKSMGKEDTTKVSSKAADKVSDDDAKLPNDQLLEKAKDLFEKKL